MQTQYKVESTFTSDEVMVVFVANSKYNVKASDILSISLPIHGVKLQFKDDSTFSGSRSAAKNLFPAFSCSSRFGPN